MATKKKQSKKRLPKKKGPKRARRRGSQTKQPFEQDTKRRIGQYGGTAEPPIMQ
ncbi:MAG TPA: hypothetical protein VHM64_13890 [Candidatus Binatia bacterium]|nr:hypothetical protein [Candidatus Binatia bacterium]